MMMEQHYYMLIGILVHEVTSPQAFEGLRLSNRKVRKPNLNPSCCRS